MRGEQSLQGRPTRSRLRQVSVVNQSSCSGKDVHGQLGCVGAGGASLGSGGDINQGYGTDEGVSRQVKVCAKTGKGAIN